MVCGVCVKVTSKKGHVKTLRRPVQHIYPLEVLQTPSVGVSTESRANTTEAGAVRDGETTAAIESAWKTQEACSPKCQGNHTSPH